MEMKAHHTIFVLMSLLAFAGCATRSAIDHSSFQPAPLSADLKQLTGVYQNRHCGGQAADAQRGDEQPYFYLWNVLFEPDEQSSRPDDTVELAVTESSGLSATLLRNGQPTEQRALLYRHNGDRAELKAKTRFKVKFPFWGIGNSLTDLAVDSQGYLQVFTSSGGTGFFFIAPMGASHELHLTYNRIEGVDRDRAPHH